MTPIDTVLDKLRAAGCQPKQSRPGQWTAKCPHTGGHRNGDKHPSLSVADGDNGAVLHCATGCPPERIVESLGLRLADLFPPRQIDVRERIAATYDYFGPDGTLVMQTVRYDPKRFAQRQPDGNGGWRWNLQGIDERPLYRLPAVLHAVATGETVWVVEGEKDADALAKAGYEATTAPMGAGKWRAEHTRWLTGATTVEIVADDDPAGRAHAAAVAAALAPVVGRVRTWLPAAGCKDVAEHLGQGRRIEDLRPLGGDEPVGDAATPLLGLLIDWAEFWATDHQSEDWLAWPLIPVGRQVALYAPAKTGKSMVTLAVVAALAAGWPILGQPARPPVHVLYLDYEMTRADLHERLEALGYGPDVDMSHLHYASLPSLPPLNTEAGAQAVLELALAVGAAVVVVDTTGRAVDGDENDAGPYRDFARHTGLALKAAGIALLRTDHAGKDKTKGQRGSSAKNDDVDVVLRLDVAEGGFVLTRTHSRVGWVPDRVHIERSDVTGVTEFRAARKARTYVAGTADLAALLDEHQVPCDWGRRKVQPWLAQNGMKHSSRAIDDAISYRREQARHTSGHTFADDSGHTVGHIVID